MTLCMTSDPPGNYVSSDRHRGGSFEFLSIVYLGKRLASDGETWYLYIVEVDTYWSIIGCLNSLQKLISVQ